MQRSASEAVGVAGRPDHGTSPRRASSPRSGSLSARGKKRAGTDGDKPSPRAAATAAAAALSAQSSEPAAPAAAGGKRFVAATTVSSNSSAVQDSMSPREKLRALAPEKCTNCSERKPRAKMSHGDTVMWLCAPCLAEKQALYQKNGTLRRKEALAALKGQFLADSALKVARSAGKETLRRVKKTCGTCGRRKAKHKATLLSGRTVVLCDKCLDDAKDRKRKLENLAI